MNQNSAIIIQARTGSTRFPNKMVIPFYKGRSILDILLERVASFKNEIQIILATTENPNDDKIVKIANNHGVKVFRGSESDVLSRFINAAEKYDTKKIIRICGDNPFLSRKYLYELINYIKQSFADYISFITEDCIPSIKTHFGLWAEYITLDALKRIQDVTTEPIYHEHVTNYAYSHPNLFSLEFLKIPKYITDSIFRLTVDTENDFNNAKKIYEQLMQQNKEIEPENIIPLLNGEILNSMKIQMNKNSK